MYPSLIPCCHALQLLLLLQNLASMTRHVTLQAREGLRKRASVTARGLRLETKMRVARKTACGDQFSGSVRYSASSQFTNAGIIFSTLGTAPSVYRANSFPHWWKLSCISGGIRGGGGGTL